MYAKASRLALGGAIVVKSSTVAAPQRPLGAQENDLEPRAPVDHPPPDRMVCHGRLDLAVKSHRSPVGTDSPPARSRPVSGRRVADVVEMIDADVIAIVDVAVARPSGSRPSI